MAESTETFIELIQRRPKVALRRTQDPMLKNAIISYDMNRRAEPTRKLVALRCI